MAKVGRNIAAVVVTYNRKELLAECLKAVCMQEYKPACVYIIDNASTDGTDEWIKDNGYDGPKEQIEFRYVCLPENIGGSGGFYTGLKMAHEAAEKFEAFWMMDDDGVPEKTQLQKLASRLDEYDYVSPMVVLKEDSTQCAMVNYTVDEMCAEAEEGIIHGAANPFNGVLFSRKLVDTIGYPVRDMFLWGDEINYGLRCIKGGFAPALVVDAIHFHPQNRQQKVKVLGKQITLASQDWKLYLLIRNTIYNVTTLSRKRHIAKVVVQELFYYSIYYMFHSPSWHNLKIIYQAVGDGLKKDLTRLAEIKK